MQIKHVYFLYCEIRIKNFSNPPFWVKFFERSPPNSHQNFRRLPFWGKNFQPPLTKNENMLKTSLYSV